MLKQKISGAVQEVILPDFPDDDNTVTTTVTKSRRVSFGPNFVKEFIVDSAITGQCMPEYEQPFPSSDSSNADSSHSAVGHSTFVVHENVKSHKPDSGEERPKPPKFASTICFSADSPTADMEFTEGCITLAKSILDKKNKEMTVFIQAKPKEGEKTKEEDTNYFEGSQFEMSVTKCLKSKENSRQQERRFAGEKTRMFGKYEDEMSMTICEKLFMEEERDSSWEESKENRMPLDAIMRHLDKDSSDSDLFNPERCFGKLLGANPFEFSAESENLNLNESMDISGETAKPSEKSANESNNFQPSFDKSDAMLSEEVEVKNNSEVGVNPPSFIQELAKDATMEEAMDISDDIQSAKMDDQSDKVDIESEIDRKSTQSSNTSEDIQSEGVDISVDIQSNKAVDFSIRLPSENPVEMESEKAEIQMHMEAERTDDIEPQKSDIESEKAVDAILIPQSEEAIDDQPEEEDIQVNMELEDNQPEKLETNTEKAADSSMNVQSQETVEIQHEKSEMSIEKDISMEKPTEKETNLEISNTNDVMDDGIPAEHSLTGVNFPNEREETQQKPLETSTNVSDDSSEKSTLLADLKVVESLTEQSKEPGCTWSLRELRHPGRQTEGLLSFSCCLLESTTSLNFTLKTSGEDSFDSCSIITDSGIHLDEEKQWRLPEYTLTVQFGFNQLKKHFEERRQRVDTIRQVPYFLDQVNSFLSKTNGYLRQIHSILTSYPGSRLIGSVLSFRLFSFPIFFSCVVSIDLGTMFRLSRSSLSFEHDFGCLDEKKVGEIFEECLKRENCLCEFVVLSTGYLVEMERPMGRVSKRGHIRLLPEELKS